MSRGVLQWYFCGSFCVILVLYFSAAGNSLGDKTNELSDPQALLEFSRPINSPVIHLDSSLISGNASLIQEYSLTAIFPVTQESLPRLRYILEPIVHSDTASVYLREVLIVSQDHIIPSLRSDLFAIMSQLEISKHIQCSIRLWRNALSESEALLQAAITSSTEWLLILDEEGLSTINNDTRKFLLSPPQTPLPLGPRGVWLSNTSCMPPSDFPQKASYLVPPFVMPGSLISHIGEHARSWVAFGAYLASVSTWGGGIAFSRPSQSKQEANWCTLGEQPVLEILPSGIDSGSLFGQWISSDFVSDVSVDSPLIFGILLLDISDLESFAPVACRLQQDGHTLHITLYHHDGSQRLHSLKHQLCGLSYSILSADESPSAWLNKIEEKPGVIVTLSESTETFEGCSSASVIRIPRTDLEHSSWMSSLTSYEWQEWNVPQVTLTIITKDRPQSLSRLMDSISNARFYGDRVDLRVNLEQSSDLETMDLVNRFRWKHGSTFVHHRVIHGGLLTAVAESWYPHSNNSYGVLLEDDVELSPLFYAWIKMTLLRYRYGSNRGKTPQMFGISLYQPKNLELDMAGRRPFNASHILRSTGADPFTPYLSQVPCSWGAVYFPEHWMEFHDYLTTRFSEVEFNLTQIVVPNVRSNQWKMSWKKYFIEMVYLRGYVMLYPNYPQYVSLSTNHLEVGSHVKIRSKEKRESFSVPLMRLRGETDRRGVELLDFPSASLPDWTLLPVLNLTGVPVTLEMLYEAAELRRTELGVHSARDRRQTKGVT